MWASPLPCQTRPDPQGLMLLSVPWHWHPCILCTDLEGDRGWKPLTGSEFSGHKAIGGYRWWDPAPLPTSHSPQGQHF